MDGYLQLLLLVVATIIVSFIAFEAWSRRRHAKQALSAQEGGSMSMSPMSYGATVADEVQQRFDTSAGLDATRSNQAYANKTYSQPVANRNTSTPQSLMNDLLVISVVADNDAQFGSYDMLQAITGAGFQFGEMSIFHYKQGNETLFSLSSASEPGDFNMDHIGDFFCDGLTLFANLREVSHPQHVFELMLSAAEQLEEDLGGELRMGTRRPWTEDAYNACVEKVNQYQLMKS